MSLNTVADFAAELRRTPDTLLEQLQAAGVPTRSASDELTEGDKQQLLNHLQVNTGVGGERKKITLTKRSTSEIKQADATGKARTIQVEVRKKRTFIQREDPVEVAARAAQVAQAAEENKELVRREEEAMQQVQNLATQEAQLVKERQEREERDERERKEREAEERTRAYAAAEAAKQRQEKEAKKEAAAEAAAAAAQRVKEQEAARLQAQQEAQERAREEAERAKDLEDRRRKALAEAEAIRAMMAAPKKVLVAKKPEKPEETKKAATPATAAAQAKKAAPAKPGDKPGAVAGRKDAPGKDTKEVKSAKLSSSWANDDANKKKGIKTRGDSTGGVGAGRGGNAWRAGGKGGRRGNDRGDQRQQQPQQQEFRAQEISVPETITVAELAHKMAVKASELITVLMKMGQMVTINQPLDQDTAMIVVEEMGHTAKVAALDDPEAFSEEDAARYTGELLPRAPVVTVMGHVDHGKTSLLDYIRRTKVASGEAGGITQHIGAYHVETDRGMVTFLDTPGHAAFTAMRARGAKATDIVILVVAADDGVMPQTIEGIQHAKAAGVPIIVAVNKIDKPEADPDRIKNDLAQHDVIPEEWGGDTQFVHLSAKKGTGIDELLEAVLVQSEVLELTAIPSASGRGVVIESRLDKGRGPIASVLVQNGTLRQGDMVLVGVNFGRVRAMLDENGKPIQEAGPSIPVEILGLDGTPDAGDEMTVVADEKKAREIALFRQGKYREVKLARASAGKLENIFESMGQEEKKVLNVVIKADVRGTLEALQSSLTELGNDEVEVRVVGGGVGGITESDANVGLAAKGVK